MKITVRNVYLTEFAEMSYFQRLFCIFAEDIPHELPNVNPLDWCARDVWRISFLLVYGVLAWVLSPLGFYIAHRLKTLYIGADALDYFPNQRIIE